MIKVLFVCLGNICRSPMAEGIFQKMINDEGLEGAISCDSAGTSDYHLGDLPDHRMIETARHKGIELTHRARQIGETDFGDFDYIVAMDRSNHVNITSHPGWKAAYTDNLLLMRSHEEIAGDALDVPDPYFGGLDGFEDVYQILWRTNRRFLNYLIDKHRLK